MRADAWIFDLDGTLTVATHDFAALKRDLGLPPDRDVLDGVAAAPAAQQPALHEAIRRWEATHLDRAAAADGAEALLGRLHERGARMGIVTRNTRPTALQTLARIGLDARFVPDEVLGRTCAPPKPAPDALHRLLSRWRIAPERAVMVGDHLHDLAAGRAAGARTVWVDHAGDGRWADAADLVVRSLRELVALQEA